MNNEDICIGDFIQFTFSEVHGGLAGKTESGEIIERLGDMLIVQIGKMRWTILTEEVDKIITNPRNHENTINDNSHLAN